MKKINTLHNLLYIFWIYLIEFYISTTNRFNLTTIQYTLYYKDMIVYLCLTTGNKFIQSSSCLSMKKLIRIDKTHGRYLIQNV